MDSIPQISHYININQDDSQHIYQISSYGGF